MIIVFCSCDYSTIAAFPPSLFPFRPFFLAHYITDPSHPAFSSFFSFSLLSPPSSPHTPTYHTPPPMIGREVLEPARQEQRGREALARRPAAEGEPDLGARRLPGAGERRPSPGGGRHEERAGPLQEHHQQVRESTRRLVRRRRKKKKKMKEEGAGGEEEMRKGYKATHQQQHFSWSGEGEGRRRSAVSAVRHRAQTRKVCFSARAVLQDGTTGKHSGAIFSSLTLFVHAASLNPHNVLNHLVSPRQLTSPSVLCLRPVSHGVFAGSAFQPLLRASSNRVLNSHYASEISLFKLKARIQARRGQMCNFFL